MPTFCHKYGLASILTNPYHFHYYCSFNLFFNNSQNCSGNVAKLGTKFSINTIYPLRDRYAGNLTVQWILRNLREWSIGFDLQYGRIQRCHHFDYNSVQTIQTKSETLSGICTIPTHSILFNFYFIRYLFPVYLKFNHDVPSAKVWKQILCSKKKKFKSSSIKIEIDYFFREYHSILNEFKFVR